MRAGSKTFMSRVISVLLLSSMLIVDASAVVKEVPVWGARSINDEGQSDNRITMEQLEDDYSDFVQTDGLREYFHKDQEDPTKVDMSEELSWLIDHEIICRDENISVTGFDGDRIPVTSISKQDVSTLNSKFVTRSDAIMYIYKAVFGPIDARTIGLETDNIRVDNGTRKTLYKMMEDHDYFTTVNRAPNSIVQSESTGGQQSVSQSCVSTPDGHYDSQTVTSQGGIAGQQTLGYAGNINSTATWRYTPQGDKYDSIFGDTNIFVSDINIAQQGNTGNGKQNIGIIDDNSKDGTAGDITGGRDDSRNTYYAPEQSQSGNHNAQQSEWAGTGGLNQGVAIETDYKQIYYVPAADLMFYRTNDVLEIYIRAALSKGLLEHDRDLRTEEFNKVFIDGSQTTAMETWSPSAPPYIVNRSSNKLLTAANVKTTQLKDVMGKNFSITYNNNNFNIHRVNLFSGSTGYFSTERVYKMDLYRYIYTFVSANEKKLSDLESEIVNYKYGMELEGVARSEDDKKIIMYLIAKGILNFDDTEDFANLYQAVTYAEFLPILYRTASPNARLDFSKIQLTDSETSWRGKGYAPQSTYIVSGSTPSNVRFVMNPELTAEQQTGDMGESPSDGTLVNPNAGNMRFSVNYDATGSTVMSDADVDALLQMVNTTSTRAGDQVMHQVGLGAYELGTVTTNGNIDDLIIYGGYCLNPAGLLVDPGGEGEESIYSKIWNYYYMLKLAALPQVRSAGNITELTNPNSVLRRNVVNNLWVISMLRSNTAGYNSALKAFDECMQDVKKPFDDAGKNMGVKEQACYDALVRMRAELVANVSTQGDGLTGPKAGSIKIEVKNPTSGQAETWTSPLQGGQGSALERAKYVLNNVSRIAYTVVNSDGEDEPVELAFDCSGISAATVDDIKTCGPAVQVTQTNSVGSPDSLAAVQSELLGGMAQTMIEQAGIDAMANVAAQTGSQETQAAASTGSKVTQYVAGKEGFLSWSQIVQFNGTKTDTSETIQIERINELTLVNKQTDTRAFFSTGEDAVALVGTAVVRGDPALGVAFKDGDGASAEYYYHIDAIRLLMNAKQESSVLSGLRGTALADTAVQENLQTVPLKTESGHTESALIGLKVQISKDDDTDSQSANGGDKNGPYFKNTMREGGNPPTRWGRYISLSQSNRALNAISRRVTYQMPGQSSTSIGYAVVIFEPIDIDKLGTAKVTEGMSMQDILDAAVKPPESEAGQKMYNDNMALANAYANWIYGTTGKTYIQTGYLSPQAYFYYQEGGDPDNMPSTVKGSLSDEQFRNITFGLYQPFVGNVCKMNEKIVAADGTIDAKYKATYNLSSDFRVMITGDRVYLCESACTNLSFRNNTESGECSYLVSNSSARPASFTIGSTFSLVTTENLSGAWVKNLKATVMATSDDGTVTCQLGPIPGMPIRFGTSSVIIDSTDFISDEGEGLMSWKSSYINDINVNHLKKVETKVIGGYYGLNYEGIYKTPLADISSGTHTVYTEPVIRIFAEGSRTKVERTYTVPNFSDAAYSGWSVQQIYDKINRGVGDTLSLNSTKTWVQFSFSAYKFRVSNGKLVASDATASDFLSPSLFTNLNDLIIDEMMNTSNGAIPINEVPDGSLLKIGDGYYYSMGTADNREFVGYAHLTSSTTGAFTPHLQDIAKSFANHYIRGGSQYINVSHFFSGCYQLPSVDRNLSPERKEALSKIAAATMSSDNNSKVCVYVDGSTSSIFDAGTSGEVGAFLYTPASISFQNVLMAYPSGTVGSTESPLTVYTICANASNSVAGAFADLPFFTDSIMEEGLLDITTTTLSASWQDFPGSIQIMEAFKEQFADAFKGDLFTLARMLMFIVLVWLVVASWTCYGFYIGNLMPIVDAIKYPTRDRGTKGIDLFKLISLGTISVDTDFKLGRFLQYDAILAILLCIVWKSGSISL